MNDDSVVPTAAIDPGVRVRDSHNPGRLGMVTSQPPRARPSGPMWQVRWDDGTISYEYEGSLESVSSDASSDPYDLLRAGKYGRASELRRNLTYIHLTGRLANLVYSMGITNTEFYPHQYRPLLTLLDSPATGILIADEVGLGKTIEAGLIWTEYRARYDKHRLLVVCPAILRDKWKDELKIRFGVSSRIVGAAELLAALRNDDAPPQEESVWITSYQSVRPPRGWQPGRGEDPEKPSAALAEFLHEHAEDYELIDMVVFDEAHYMRNRETGAWHLGDLLRQVSGCQTMLSATPINLKNEDLFSLLTLLDPDHFRTPDDLERLIAANAPLVDARDAALDTRKSASDVLVCQRAPNIDQRSASKIDQG